MVPVIVATLVVALTGLIIGILLGIAGEKFKVEVDERELLVREALPGVNCGACGYAGCDAAAKAVAEGSAPVNLCPVGGVPVADKVAEIMGVTAEATEKNVAFVKCSGTCDKAVDYSQYYGVKDCVAAMSSPGEGGKACSYGCMGLGSCVKACPFDAIHVIDGIAKVDVEKCTACNNCVKVCPKNIIEIVPAKAEFLVRCNSLDKGKDVKSKCDAGCIGCSMCVRVCEYDAVHVEDNLAYIDQSKCVKCGKCAEKCPTKVIRDLVMAN